MGDVAGVLLTLGLSWLAGALCVTALWRGRGQGLGAICIGYGYLIGLLVTTLLLRAASLVGWRWSFAGIAVGLVLVACGAAYAAWPLSMLRGAYARSIAGFKAMPGPSRAVFSTFLALSGINVVALACCVAWGLLMPFDAMAHWADKSRVWFEYGRIMPFVGATEWLRLGDVQHFWDPNPTHPGAIPLLQVWTTLGMGHWDEALMNMPWPATMVAFGFAFYGQARRLGAGAAKAMVCTYLLLSLPYLQINVAVASMADLFVAVAYGSAAISLWQWTRTRQWQDAALAIAMALYCAMTKNEGIFWSLTLVPAVIVAVHRRVGLFMCAAVAVAALLYLPFGPTELTIFGYVVKKEFFNVGLPTLEHMFVMDNWHLLWYATTVIVVANARRLLQPSLVPMSVTMAAAAAFVVIVYFFSTAAGGVNNESLVNRFLFQAVPALAFYLLAILQDRAGADERAGTAVPSASAAA